MNMEDRYKKLQEILTNLSNTKELLWYIGRDLEADKIESIESMILDEISALKKIHGNILPDS